mgnify:FL=1
MYCRDLGVVMVVLFIWIWSLPLLILSALLLTPVSLVLLPISFAISVLVQRRCPITPTSSLRCFVSSMRLHHWFPCNTVQLPCQTVVAVHPHGLLCCGALVGLHFVPGSTTIICVAPALFYIPVLGWCLPLLGCIPADSDSMLAVLRRGHSLIVVPGGVPELVLAENGNDCALYPRYGFLRLARATGVPVMSVFVKGECATYSFIRLPLLRWRVGLSWFSNIPLVFPLFRGHYWSWLPKRTPLRLRTHMHESVPTRNEYRVRLASLQIAPTIGASRPH